MKLLPIKKDKWDLYAVCNADGSCPLLLWLSGLNAKYKGSVRRLKSIFDSCAESPDGPRLLSKEISHEFDKKNSLYEFVAGDLRVVWFYHPSKRMAVICEFGFIRKGQHPSKVTKEKAIKIKSDFATAVVSGSVTIQGE